jgi:hypothetical protein
MAEFSVDKYNLHYLFHFENFIQQSKKCLDAYNDSCFAEFIWTDDLEVSDIVRAIENRINSFYLK